MLPVGSLPHYSREKSRKETCFPDSSTYSGTTLNTISVQVDADTVGYILDRCGAKMPLVDTELPALAKDTVQVFGNVYTLFKVHVNNTLLGWEQILCDFVRKRQCWLGLRQLGPAPRALVGRPNRTHRRRCAGFQLPATVLLML